MSFLWYKPAIKELEKEIEVLLQEKVKLHLNENKVYAKSISGKVYDLFVQYELKMTGLYAFSLILLLFALWLTYK